MRLIDADAFKKWLLENSINEREEEESRQIGIWIDAFPTIEPECKRGKWIELTNTNHTYICSECGRMLVNISEGKNNVAKSYPYCHCGADMREGDAECNHIRQEQV